MDLSDKNILNVYEKYKDSYYILNSFTETQQLSIFLPNQSNPFELKNSNSAMAPIDKENDYQINDLGFRGKLKDNPEIIAIGCSYTFGLGVPEGGTWPSILGSKINKDILNLGIPGITIKKISELIIKYVSRYDKPKIIFALFPPFFRASLIEDVEFYSSTRSLDPTKQGIIEKQSSFQSQLVYDMYKKEIFFKKQDDSPYFKSKDKNIRYMENVFSPHQLISDAIDSISIIQDFCYSHDIEFYWSTWDSPSSMLMDSLFKIPNFKLKNYIKFADDKFNNYQTKDGRFKDNFCNLSHDSKLINHPSWDVGSDLVYSYGKVLSGVKPHPGIHFQYHVAELFLDQILVKAQS